MMAASCAGVVAVVAAASFGGLMIALFVFIMCLLTLFALLMVPLFVGETNRSERQVLQPGSPRSVDL
jgi:hypothetical protein